MNRTLKKTLLCGLLAACLMAMLSVAAWITDEYFIGPSDVFVDVCDHLFTEGSGYKAIDQNGDDITTQFVSDYREAYLSGNFEIIFEEVSNNLRYITWKEDEPRKYVDTNGIVSQHFYATAEAEHHTRSTTVEVEFQLTGHFDYSDDTGQIDKDSPAAYLTVNHIGIGVPYSGKHNRASTSGTIRPDQESVTFTGKFDVAVNFTFLGFVIWSENVTFEGEATGYSHRPMEGII